MNLPGTGNGGPFARDRAARCIASAADRRARWPQRSGSQSQPCRWSSQLCRPSVRQPKGVSSRQTRAVRRTGCASVVRSTMRQPPGGRSATPEGRLSSPVRRATAPYHPDLRPRTQPPPALPAASPCRARGDGTSSPRKIRRWRRHRPDFRPTVMLASTLTSRWLEVRSSGCTRQISFTGCDRRSSPRARSCASLALS